MNYKSQKRLFACIIILITIVFIEITIAYSLYTSSQVNSEAEKVASRCRQSTYKEECYIREFKKISFHNSLSTSINILTQLERIDSSTLYCHGIAHAISIGHVEKNPNNWLSLFKEIDLLGCSRGYFHGAIEGYSQFHPDFILNEKSMPQICNNIVLVIMDKISQEKTMSGCMHAIGHMLLVQDDANFSQAVDVCSRLSQPFMQECMVGVFMEGTDRQNLSLHGIAEQVPWDEQYAHEQDKLCMSFSGIAAASCWVAAAKVFATVADGNPKKVIELCNRAEKQYRAECSIQGISHLAFLMISNRARDTYFKDLCTEFISDEAIFTRCIQLTAQTIIQTSDSYISQAKKFCKNLSSLYQGLCFDAIAKKV